MAHRMDDWSWCERCGLSWLEIVDTNAPECVPPPAGLLATRRLAAVVARAPLMRLGEQVVERLRSDGVIP